MDDCQVVDFRVRQRHFDREHKRATLSQASGEAVNFSICSLNYLLADTQAHPYSFHVSIL